MNKIKLIWGNAFVFAVVIVVISISSCKKFVEIPAPKNTIVSSTVFADSASATSAVLGVYITMMQNGPGLNINSGGITVYTGLASDELTTTFNGFSYPDFYGNSILPTLFENDGYFWSVAYKTIYQVNAGIEGITESKTLGTSVKDQLIGELKVLRGFSYFNLINLYGPVPLVLSTDYKKNSVLPRTSTDVIYQQIISDLSQAQNLLPEHYVTSQRIRPNKYVALALLSKVYLYQKQWSDADETASQIINSGSYSLEQDLNNVFLPSSNEAIWQIVPVFSRFETAEGYNFLPTSNSAVPNFVISDYLLNSIESGDKRKDNWMKFNMVGGTPYYYPYKYKLGYDNNSAPLEYYMIFRLAEQYLLRAEAEAKENKLTDALNDLNVIRARAGLQDFNSGDQLSILNAIQQERRVELFCEWGNRWNDLRRNGTIDTILGNEKANWKSTDSLFSIPQVELTSNPFLVQNPGY